MDDPSGTTESIYDMVFDEVNGIASFNFGERHNFRPLGEVISYPKDEPMTFRRWRTDGSYNINSPSLERP